MYVLIKKVLIKKSVFDAHWHKSERIIKTEIVDIKTEVNREQLT